LDFFVGHVIKQSLQKTISKGGSNRDSFNAFVEGLWGTLKNKVYTKDYHTVDELREAVEDALNRLDKRTLRKAVKSIVKRCNLCINQNGGLFEYLS
jgi:hypothetical protein